MVAGLSEDVEPMVGGRLFAYFRQSVRSLNFKVATAALEVTVSVHFLKHFQPMLPTLMDDVAVQTEHWCETVRILAASAIQLSELEHPGAVPRRSRSSDQRESVQTKWMAVFKQAGRSVDLACFTESVARLE
jgi:hypothetical protein